MSNAETAPGSGRRALMLAAALSALALAACGSDGDDATSAPTTVATASTPAPTDAPTTAPPTTATDDIADYCEAEARVEAAASSGDPSADPKAFAAALAEPAAAAAAAAPAEVSAAASDAATAVEQVAAGGDASVLDSIDRASIHAFDRANCGWNVVPVSAKEYHFTGVPDTLPAGVHDFELANNGKELHVLIVVRRKPGITASWDQLLADPAAETKVDTVASGGAPPGDTGYVVADLAPGSYLVLCPIPQGTTLAAEGTGAPHFTLGMHQELTVN